MDRPAMRLYHTGVIVDDLDRATQSMRGALGLKWAPPKVSTVPLRGPDGVQDREVRFTYSLEGPHFIELLEQINPAPYVNLSGGRRVHHVGYFTEDLVAASAHLESSGYPCELSGVGDDGQVARATFHSNPDAPGLWIELVSSEIAGEIEGWIAEAAAAQGLPFESPFARESSPIARWAEESRR